MNAVQGNSVLLEESFAFRFENPLLVQSQPLLVIDLQQLGSASFTLGPLRPRTVPGASLMLNKFVLNRTDFLWGTPYKAVSALNPKLL